MAVAALVVAIIAFVLAFLALVLVGIVGGKQEQDAFWRRHITEPSSNVNVLGEPSPPPFDQDAS